MGVIATFDPTVFKLRYPEFSTVADALLQSYFDEATIYLRNDGGGVVPTVAIQSTLLNMLTAHIAQLNATIAGIAPSGLVGRISNASEGSVSVATDYGSPTQTEAWYIQTRYGAAYWAATASYRTMRYRPRAGRFMYPYGNGSGLQ